MGVANDDRLAAAQVEACQRGLVGHPAREVQDIAQRVVVTGVRVEPGAAKSWAAGPSSESR